MDSISLEELIMAVRRQSQGFSRGTSTYRGVTHHPSGMAQHACHACAAFSFACQTHQKQMLTFDANPSCHILFLTAIWQFHYDFFKTCRQLWMLLQARVMLQ